MSKSAIANGLTRLLQPSLPIIAITFAFALLIPLLLHLFVYRSSAKTTLPSFLLLGPGGSGKTSLLTLFERGRNASTRTSQLPLEIEICLPVATEIASSRFRSANDPSLEVHEVFMLIDTPGHGKLRHHAFDRMANTQNLKGIIFLVDAASMSPGSSELRAAAEYLHDVLLLLQRRHSSSPSAQRLLPLLIASNKMDLFTAIPAPLVLKALEVEIGNVRESRGKGLLDSGIGVNAVEAEDEKEWLGEGGETRFEMSQMEQFGIEINIEGGAVISSKGSDIERWWQWVGNCL